MIVANLVDRLPLSKLASGSPAEAQAEPLAPELVPFISDRHRSSIRDEYLPAADHKSLAISDVGLGFITSQKDDETAKLAALSKCQELSDTHGPGHRCLLYAIGDTVVFTHGRPPMPPQPWLVHDPSIERAFSATEVPLVSDKKRQQIEKNYPAARKSKALALAPGGYADYYFETSAPEEAARRALEKCGIAVGVPCLIVALDDVFVVPIPTTMKVVGFFGPNRNDIEPGMREEVARLRSDASRWNAVAVGSSGHPGVATKAADEQEAVAAALAGCMKRDRNCHIIAIGPFSVEPN